MLVAQCAAIWEENFNNNKNLDLPFNKHAHSPHIHKVAPTCMHTHIHTHRQTHMHIQKHTLKHTQTPMYTNTRIHIRQLGESATSLVTHRVLTESGEEVAGLLPVDAVGAVEELSDEFSHHLRVTLPVVGQALGRCPPVNIHRLPQGTAQHGLRLQVDKQVDL